MYTFDNIFNIMDEIKNRYETNKKNISLILDFSKFYITFFDSSHLNEKTEQNYLKSCLSEEIENYSTKDFITKQFYTDHPQGRSLVFCIKKVFIQNLVKLFKKSGLIITECKIDILGIYKYYENKNITVLTLGDELSSFITIENKKIKSFKTSTLNIKDKDNINPDESTDENLEMIVLDYALENINIIFEGCNLLKDINFINTLKFNSKNIKIKNFLPYIFFITAYIFISYLLNNDNQENLNHKLRQEIEILQYKLSEVKNEKIPDYTKDFNELNEIIQNMKYHNHYKFLEFLINQADNNTGFSKITYENSFWIIEGDSTKFKNIESFETKLGKFAQKIELIFIKSQNKTLTFQYKIGDIIWN